MSVKVFGPSPWSPAPGVAVKMIATPAGKRCIHCDEPIADSDYGIMVPHGAARGRRASARNAVRPEDSARMLMAGDVPFHRECFLWAIFGSLGHQKGLCSCRGGTEEDPPGMSRRQAARAAVAYAMRARGKGRN